MAIIAFWSNEEKETAQTMSMVALSTHMAIEHNYKILNVSTSFNDETLENSYWDLAKMEQLVKTISNNSNQIGLESGIEGLIKIINSNKTSANIVSNYTKIVFKDRLDVLCAPKTKNYEDYKQISELYPSVLQVADRSYDLVFVDISKRMPENQIKEILELSDIIIVNMTQRIKTIDDFMKLREENDFFKKNNILLNLGRYDKYSKYNAKNITRYLEEKNQILTIPYNTLYFEATNEAGVPDLFLKFKKSIDSDDRNAIFIQEVNRATQNIIYRLQELEARM